MGESGACDVVVAFTNERQWRAVVQIVTIARFRRPTNPQRCNVHRYHVWRWKTLANDPNWQPLTGMTCQCGCLTWTARHHEAREV